MFLARDDYIQPIGYIICVWLYYNISHIILINHTFNIYCIFINPKLSKQLIIESVLWHTYNFKSCIIVLFESSMFAKIHFYWPVWIDKGGRSILQYIWAYS
jgi:hypothetical protein